MTRPELCKNNMDALSQNETVRIVTEIINLLREQKIPNMRANDEDLCGIIYDVMKDENYRFASKLGTVFTKQAYELNNPNVQLENMIEENLLETKRLFISMGKDSCFMDFHDRIVGQVTEYLVSKNRDNLIFENRYYDIKSDMKRLIEKEYVKYMNNLAENNINTMMPILTRDSEKLLIGDQKNDDNQLDSFVIS